MKYFRDVRAKMPRNSKKIVSRESQPRQNRKIFGKSPDFLEIFAGKIFFFLSFDFISFDHV